MPKLKEEDPAVYVAACGYFFGELLSVFGKRLGSWRSYGDASVASDPFVAGLISAMAQR